MNSYIIIFEDLSICKFRHVGKSGTRCINSYKNIMILLHIKMKKDFSIKEVPALILKKTKHAGSIL